MNQGLVGVHAKFKRHIYFQQLMEGGQSLETGPPAVRHVEMAVRLEPEPVVNQRHSMEGNIVRVKKQKLRVASSLIAVSGVK